MSEREMASAAIPSAGFRVPSSSRTVVVYPLCASNLGPRASNAPFALSPISLQAQHTPSIGKTHGSVGFVNETVETTEETDDTDEDNEEATADDTDEDGDKGWQDELLNELNPLLYLQPHNQRKAKRRKEVSHGTPPSPKPEAEAPDWTEHARQRALRALEAQNPAAANFYKMKLEPTSTGNHQRKKKKKKSQKSTIVKENSGLRKEPSKISLRKLEESIRLQDNSSTITHEADSPSERLHGTLAAVDVEFDLDGIDSIDDLPMGDNIEFGRWNTFDDGPAIGNNSEFGRTDTSKAFLLAFEHATEQGSDRERNFNKQLVGAKSALEVLEIVGNAEVRTKSLGFPSLLTPLNAATALHRIAKHMETSGTPKGDRLAFARKKHMAELVASSMEVLAGCSAQGLSNIAWALSKIGGNTLYFSEIDLMAKAILSKVSDFHSQNVANTLGAYASMQHAAPSVFASLRNHALGILEEFSSQELAQVFWAHAELTQPADPLLDALDGICLSSEKSLTDSFVELDLSAPNAEYFLSSMSSFGNFNPFKDASAEHLANLGWSYAVLDQINRPAFKYLWQMLESILDQNINTMGDRTGGLSTWHLSQIHQVNLCLKYGYSCHASTLKVLLKDAAARAWEMQKRKMWSPSEYQKDVKWFLVSMAQDWVAEYTASDYSLDLALPEKKMAIEIDGPSHFIRNNGLPLGHTILKRRLLSQAGWRVLPISYEVWEELDGEIERMNFLKELLRTSS